MFSYRELPPDYVALKHAQTGEPMIASPAVSMAAMDVLGESVTEKANQAMRNMTPAWWGAATAAIFGIIAFGLGRGR